MLRNISPSLCFLSFSPFLTIHPRCCNNLTHRGRDQTGQWASQNVAIKNRCSLHTAISLNIVKLEMERLPLPGIWSYVFFPNS